MTPEQNTGQQTQGQPQSPDRRRFLRNAGRIATRVAGYTLIGAGSYDLLTRPNAIVDIALNAKDKSPDKTNSQIKQEISHDVSGQGGRQLFDAGVMGTGFLLALRETK